MKTQRYLFLLSIICLSFLLVKCGKDGAVGPAGNTGDKGAAGATGAVGPAGPAGANGSAGSVIYSGNSVPAVSKGIVGDFYLDTSTGLLYGPKTANGWGTGFSLKGATGATGTAGSTTLSGAGVPAATLGKTGDYYLDKTNYLLYGPKTASGWGVPINLQGPAGPQGPAGNANVKVDVFTVKTADWLYNDIFYVGTSPGGSSGYFSKYYDHANALITDDLLNTGMVLVYFQSVPDYNAPTEWQPLPFSFGGGYSYNWAYIASAGKVRLEFYFVGINSTPPVLSTFNLPTAKFKVITVTGSLLSAIKKDHINLNDYKAVNRYLGIQ